MGFGPSSAMKFYPASVRINIWKVIAILKQRGCNWTGPNMSAISANALRHLQRSFAGNDIVFSTGGIGATPDDHTRHAQLPH
jgi:molybdopterin biosynthesis enzyme MoaB